MSDVTHTNVVMHADLALSMAQLDAEPGQDRVMLTTIDNPYDPFTQFKEWYVYDTSAGYHSSALLARIARSSDELSEADQQLAYELAIDEIVKENALGLHRKAYPNELHSVTLED